MYPHPECLCIMKWAACRVPAYYALILRSLTVLEGLALSADPEYRLLGRAYPYMASRILTDPAPQLRASLEELILSGGGLRWCSFFTQIETRAV